MYNKIYLILILILSNIIIIFYVKVTSLKNFKFLTDSYFLYLIIIYQTFLIFLFLKADPCIFKPCRNNGTCQKIGSSSYICKCQPNCNIGFNCDNCYNQTIATTILYTTQTSSLVTLKNYTLNFTTIPTNLALNLTFNQTFDKNFNDLTSIQSQNYINAFKLFVNLIF